MGSHLRPVAAVFAGTVGLWCGAVHADPWTSCPSGQGPAVQVQQCYSTGASPFPDCPTGEVIAPDDLVTLVEAAYPNGSACEQEGYTIGDPYTVDNDTQFGYFKRCKNGEAIGAQPGILGAKQCSASTVCTRQVGDRQPAGSYSPALASGSDSYCVAHCEVQLFGFGLTFGPAGPEQQQPIYFEVTATSCSIGTGEPPVEALPEYCWERNGQQICSFEGMVGVVVNGATIEPGPNGALCADGQCVDGPGSVVTAQDGAQIADAGTSTPPAPDNGTAGQAVAPDLTINTGGSNGAAYSYWSPGTVATSTTAPPGNPGTGGGGGTCGGPSQPACKVELQGSFAGPELDSGVPSFSEALQEFRQRIGNAPLISAVSNLGSSIPAGGVPPSASFTLDALGGETFEFKAPQPVVDAITAVLPTIMLCVWALVAIVLFLRA